MSLSKCEGETPMYAAACTRERPRGGNESGSTCAATTEGPPALGRGPDVRMMIYVVVVVDVSGRR